MKILAAIDGSPSSNVAIEEIARRPWPAGSELKIVNVIDPWPIMPTESWALPPSYYEEITRAATDDADWILTAARERFEERDGLVVSTEVLAGSPARSIVDEVERWHADLVVLGSHGYGAREAAPARIRLALGRPSCTVLGRGGPRAERRVVCGGSPYNSDRGSPR